MFPVRFSVLRIQLDPKGLWLHDLIFSEEGTLEYRINMQQILFKFWVLAHLHAYFVLHNSTEKNVVQNLFFTTYSRVHISSDTAFLKILKKPSIVQE